MNDPLPSTETHARPSQRPVAKAALLHSFAAKLNIAENKRDVDRELEDVAVENLSEPSCIAFLNARALQLASGSPNFARSLLNAQKLYRDGSGLNMMLRLIGRSGGINMNGTDFIPKILRRNEARSIALFGTKEPYLTAARSRLLGEGFNVMAVADGFLSDAVYSELAANLRPEIIVLGMGMPKQERIAESLMQSLSYPCLIICGGAILDFQAERFPRAPEIAQRLGIEWVYRMVREPRRLFSRYVLEGIPFAVALSISLVLKKGKK